MNSLSDDVREVIGELDADGGGFRTGEAADLLVRRVVVAGVCDADGEPRPKVRLRPGQRRATGTFWPHAFSLPDSLHGSRRPETGPRRWGGFVHLRRGFSAA
jgi:hypothetical protein